jgi:hypothetical protein
MIFRGAAPHGAGQYTSTERRCPMVKRVSRNGTVDKARGSRIAKKAKLIVQGVSQRIQEVREAQLREGNFDCYGKAEGGYCDQAGCRFRDECLEISRPALAMVPVRRKK